jgi:lyso-ornithine lipid O-acyltransferase
LSRLRGFLVLAGFAGLTLPLMPLQQFFVWTRSRYARTFPMHYHRIVARILGIHVRLKGELPQNGPLLVASNHVSWLDIVVLSSVAPLSFIAKKEVNGWPFFGALARLQRTVFVDRDRRHKTHEVRDEIGERLADGDILVLFSEGTSGDGASVLPFKSSLFAAAEKEGVKVQPLSIAYHGHRNLPMTRRLRPFYAWYGDMDLPPHLWEALKTGPIEVTVICHPPLTASDAGGRKQLAKLAELQVRRSLMHALHGRDEMG